MEVQDAVRQSISAFGAVFPPEMQKDLRLEEVLLSNDEAVWNITVSFRNPDLSDVEISAPAPNSLAAMLGAKGPNGRIYKTIRVRSEDGRLLGISNPV